jgi:UDP-glucose 4-epimerase
MRIFVTGATGFLGSYLVAELLAGGHEVAALLRPGSARWRLNEQAHRITAVEGSLDETESLRVPLKRFHPEAVAHLAWRGVGNADRNSPLQARNVPYAADLVALAADLGACAFVGAGSQAEYGPHNRIINEADAARPTTLYGHAKLAAGMIAGALCAERGLRFAWLRIFSTYGPKDADYWLIPSMIRTLRSGQRMSLTRCEQLWSFLHARDAAAAFRIALVDPRAQGIYNVGGAEAPPLRKTVTALRDLVDASAELGFGDLPYRTDQVMILRADITRLSTLGWEPQVPLSEGLSETVAWYDAQRS